MVGQVMRPAGGSKVNLSRVMYHAARRVSEKGDESLLKDSRPTRRIHLATLFGGSDQPACFPVLDSRKCFSFSMLSNRPSKPLRRKSEALVRGFLNAGKVFSALVLRP